ncbi:class I SAM-dependent methyltransferase [Comamonas serinivorans]|uniref:class I SAM-dependent methyltransferase n=1 Tax=Comamonas serinivorans TaxID=1082851 RepID=UPI00196B225F|nr:class I SAM-dependent methyltransferase [Comamonas serinivorans]
MTREEHEPGGFALPMMQAAWQEPVWLGSPAPWAGHLPFAAWLMAVMRPRTLVELGVYSGISYLGFCEAAVQHDVPLQAWGVDTWAGDPHAGHYGDQVLQTLKGQHDARYGGFSTLLQKTFDEALADVADGSVDLLHIDGLHTYDAVRHDFETWQPKLSERGVVLFHDVAVRRDDFGVWRFWGELAARFPSFAFAHSHGLGVLLVGAQAPTPLRALCDEPAQLAAAQRYFGALGERFERRAEALHQATQLNDLRAQAERDAAAVRAQGDWIAQQDEQLREAGRLQARQQAMLDEAQHAMAARDAAVQQLQARLDEHVVQTEALRRTQAERESQWAHSLREQGARLSSEMQAWQQRLAQVTRQARRDAQDLQAARTAARLLGQQVDELLASRSWRATAGLRKLGTLARQVRHSPAGTSTAVSLRRVRNAMRYAAAGNWRELLQRVQHVKQQAAEAQRLEQFEGKAIACGILCTPHTLYVAHALQVALARAGIPATLVDEADDYPLDLYVVVCPQMFKSLPPGEKRVAFQMEQTVSSRWFTPDYLAVLENSLAAIDYAQTNLANLAEFGIVYPHVYLVPIGGVQGYRTWLNAATPDVEPAPDEVCDVLFYGDANAPRRKRLLAEIGKHHAVRVVGNAFGADMHRALAGAKVVVNLHYYEGALLETTRLYECLSLGKSVVSETAADQAEHQALEAAVRFVDVDDAQGLIAAIGEALAEQADAAQRARHAQRCEAVVAASQARFEFMLYRLLVSRRVLSYAQFTQLTATTTVAPRLALSLPETTVRRQAFEAIRPADVQVFDGLRYAPGWIGCAMSYKYLAQAALRQGLATLEVMEDDVEFPPDYDLRRSAVKAYLEQRAGEWDVFVGLMAEVHPDTRVLKVERVGNDTFVTLDRMISAVSNIYGPRALSLMAQWDETVVDADTNTIDRFIQRQTALRVVVALPFLVGHHEALDSSLWGISNVRYSQLIADAEAKLWALAEQAQAGSDAV